MTLQERIDAFVALGERIKQLPEDEFERLAGKVENNNSWFTSDQTRVAMNGLGKILSEEGLISWIGKYSIKEGKDPKRVGLMMAGNVPGVGFHDLMVVLLSGHEAHVKLSASDQVLMKWLVDELLALQPEFRHMIYFEEMLKGMDAYIATGSDNSARYFEYYFGKYPSLIRKNRTSVALLDGRETKEDYHGLAKDVFQYFGLGCRNVSKLYVKNESQVKDFLKAVDGFHFVISHHKYLNNYEYNKSIYLVNREYHLDNGFLLCRPSEELVSPVSVLHYEIYHDQAELVGKLDQQKEKIQCVVSKEGWFEGSFPFGQAQYPGVEDYADDVDTMAFMLSL